MNNEEEDFVDLTEGPTIRQLASLPPPPGKPALARGGDCRHQRPPSGDAGKEVTGRNSDRENHSSGVGGSGPPPARQAMTIVLDDDDEDEDDDAIAIALPPRSGGGGSSSTQRHPRDEAVNLSLMEMSPPATQELPMSSQSQDLGEEIEATTTGRRKRKATSTVDKEERARQKALEREQKAAAKEEEKRQKAEQREAEKKRKAQAKAEEKAKQKALKEAEKWKSRQERGAFADQEISVMIEAGLYSSPTGIQLVEVLKTKYDVSPPQDFPVQGLIRWERRPCAVDGADDPNRGAAMVDHLLVLWTGEDFIKMVDQSTANQQPLVTQSGDFPFLQQAIERIRAAHPTYPKLRLCLVLQGVREEIARRTRQEYNRVLQQHWTAQACQLRAEHLEEALVWLHLCHNVDTKLTSSVEDTIQYMMDMTRAWAEAPYRKKLTALECVGKPKGSAGGYDGSDKSLRGVVANTFLRQLMMIPGLSQGKAQALIRHFPTPRSLVDSLTDPRLSVHERENLLTNKMGDKNFTVLARRVYTVFTSENPELIITTSETANKNKKAKEATSGHH